MFYLPLQTGHALTSGEWTFQIDYEKLSKILGLKNAHSANTALYNVRKKVKKYRSLVDGANVVQSPTPTPKATPKATPRKRASAGHPETPKSGKAAKRVKSEASTPKELQPPAEDEQDGGI